MDIYESEDEYILIEHRKNEEIIFFAKKKIELFQKSILTLEISVIKKVCEILFLYY